MRKIRTQQEREKKETRNKTIVGIALVAIMILSTAGYSFFSRDKTSYKKIKHNNLEFALGDDGLWHFVIQGYEFATVYNPKETENISLSLFLNLASYQNKPLYFSYDSNRQGMEEITRNIERFIGRVNYACLAGEECKEDFPVKNCTDNMIIFKIENRSLINQEDNCVYITAENSEVARASDAFIFRILGV